MSGFLGGGIGPVAIKRRSGLAAPVPVAGAELIINGDMESGNPPASWSADNSVVLSIAAERTGGAGTQSLQLTNAFSGYGRSRQVVNATSGAWYLLTGYVISGGASPKFYGVNFNSTGFTVTSTSWSQYILTNRATGIVTLGVENQINTNGLTSSMDDVSFKHLTLATLLSTRAYASADCDLSVGVTRTAGTQAGLCARLDSASSPANFIIAYETGEGRVRVDKCVAGVYTNIIDGAVTYAAGRVLRLVCSGNDVSCYYHGTQVGSTVTVSDAGIVSNTRHGKFSTYASNTLAGYVAA